MTIGNYTKSVVCVNGLNIGPTIRANQGDTLKINVMNNLLLSGITVHFHGITMKGTPWLDGVPMITQCPIAPGTNMTYEFVVNRCGTFWYHSHQELQRDDSFYGPLIVEDINVSSKINYDEEYIIMLSDFNKEYSDETIQMLTSNDFHSFGSPYKLLINGIENYNISVSYGKIYLLRFICATAHSYLNISIPNHNFTIVEVEGTYTNPLETSNIWINAGQRYTVLLHPNNPGCYYINISSMSDPINILMGLIYDNCNNSNFISSINTNFFNTSLLTNKYPTELPIPNKNISIYMNVHTVNGNGRIFTFNNVSFKFPTDPILLSYYLNSYVPNNLTQIIHVEFGDVIDIELINDSPYQHSYHQHGTSFYVLNSFNPIERDTVTIESGNSVIIRNVFDNNGVWFSHCHSSKHSVQKLNMVYAYKSETIPRPPNNFIICGREFGEIKQGQYLFGAIYSLGGCITLVMMIIIGLSIYIYKLKRIREERMRLIA
jgi:iron transport multicopper oxidase